MISEKKTIREKPIPTEKINLVTELSKKMGKFRTVLLASCKGLPGKQFHEIKKNLRGRAEFQVAKISSVKRAIDSVEKGSLKNLKNELKADMVIFFSDMDPFELSGLLTDSQSSTKAKEGDVAPYDIEIEPGPTELIPGPAISELGSVGLKIAVKDGKLEIQHGAVIAKEGELMSGKVVSVLGKLNITPMKVGFLPLAAYDREEDKTYVGIKIDKVGTLRDLQEMIKKALGFAVGVGYPAKETITYFISKAAMEEKALEKLIGKADEGEKKIEENIDKEREDENEKEVLNTQKNEDKKE